MTISQALFDANYENPQNLFTFVNMAGGVTGANTQTLDSRAARLPGREDPDQDAVHQQPGAGLDTLLNLLYVLLSLSIIVSLFGIVNTLVLTVFERTRELGMLRAVGMTRRQVRRMIRHESVITALLGAAFGIPLGVVLAVMVGDRDRLPGLHDPVGHAGRVRDRRDPRRPARGDLPGPACRAAQRARSAAVRMTPLRGDSHRVEEESHHFGLIVELCATP